MTNKILFIEDDRMLVRVYRAKLEAENIIAEIKENGFDIVELVLKINPQLVILDIIMPEKNGFKVIQELKANDKTKGIPIIVLTQLNSAEDREKVKNLGADILYSKQDISIKEVIEKIKEKLISLN